MIDVITDPQSQSSIPQANPNINAVSNAELLGSQEDNARILARQTPSGTSRGVQQLGGASLFADSGNKRIGVTDNNVNQVLIGNQPTFGEGFYVTKPGKDAISTTSPDDFIFNSNQNVFKIVQTGTTSLPSLTVADPGAGAFGSGEATSTIAHGLSFTPLVIAAITTAGTSFPLPTQSYFSSGATADWYFFQASTDATNVVLYTDAMVYGHGATLGGSSYAVKYYLLQETAV